MTKVLTPFFIAIVFSFSVVAMDFDEVAAIPVLSEEQSEKQRLLTPTDSEFFAGLLRDGKDSEIEQKIKNIRKAKLHRKLRKDAAALVETKEKNELYAIIKSHEARLQDLEDQQQSNCCVLQ